ncbi:hypothetical protein TNCV_4215151 [Trichonephila clavipes]|nr:hypothetical protein TNCV_4215151 [Trichonephila clavipes]
MKDFKYAENADMHYGYGCANGNGKAALRMDHAQFPDRRMPVHSSYIVNSVKHVRSMSPDVMLVGEELHAVQS